MRLRRLLLSRWARGLFMPTVVVAGGMVAADMEEEVVDTSAGAVPTSVAEVLGWGVAGFEGAAWWRPGASVG